MQGASSLSVASQRLRALAEDEEKVCLEPLQQWIGSLQEVAQMISELPIDSMPELQQENPEYRPHSFCKIAESCCRGMTEMMRQACISKIEAQARLQNLYEQRKEIQLKGEQSTVLSHAWLTRFEQEIEYSRRNATAESIQAMPEWKTWKETMEQVSAAFESTSNFEVDHDSETDDGDLVMTRDETSLVCPISQAIFINPVKNPSCGHSYSKAAITMLINGSSSRRTAGSIPCPVAGCLHQVALKNLVPNALLERKLARQQNS